MNKFIFDIKMTYLVFHLFILLLSFGFGKNGVKAGPQSQVIASNNGDLDEHRSSPVKGPTFDISGSANVTGFAGKTVELTCHVNNAENRTISWVRHRDIHLLTVGRYTYTSDQRFEAYHIPHSNKWSLRIRYSQRRDSGIYECQVSTTPPIGHFIWLTVIEPVTEIIGGPELYIDQGSTINLTCVMRFASEAASFSHTVRWSHNGRPLHYDSPHGVGGVSLVTEHTARATTSRLMIMKAAPADSGVYACAPLGADVASVRVHILNGEHPAAMYHSLSIVIKCSNYLIVSFSIFLLVNHILKTP